VRSRAIAVGFAAAIAVTAAAPARADRWLVDLSMRGAGSVELEADAPMNRRAVVPSMAVRLERRLGPLHVGGVIGAGLPAYYGQHELALAADVERVVRDRRCGAWSDDDPCTAARVVLAAGIDLGLGLLFYDAPPETASGSDAVLYWGPLGRARAQLRVLWPTPNGKELGVVVGVDLSVSSSHYMSTATGTGTRLEPGLELGLELRL